MNLRKIEFFIHPYQSIYKLRGHVDRNYKEFIMIIVSVSVLKLQITKDCTILYYLYVSRRKPNKWYLFEYRMYNKTVIKRMNVFMKL